MKSGSQFKREIIDISISAIQEGNIGIRKFFENGSLGELAESIAKMGMIYPLVVCPNKGGDKYSLVIGSRRLKAAEKAGLKKV